MDTFFIWIWGCTRKLGAFSKEMWSRLRNTILWSSDRFRTTTPHENRQNVTAVSAKLGQSWYSWLETSPWGWYGDLISCELFDLRTRDLNISEKELHVYFIFPFVRPQDTNTNVMGVKKPIAIFRYSMEASNHECQRFLFVYNI